MTITITMPELHHTQQVVKDAPERFRVLACGRRWGKTRLGSALCVSVALMGGRAWWVAPSYKMAAVGWRLASRLGRQIPGTNIGKVERLVSFPGGGEVQVRSADDPDSLRGEGLDFLVMDECAFIREAAWQEALRPALSDRQGRAMFISTPKGRNWFWRLWQQGNDPENHEYKSFCFPTSDNPYILDSEIEAAKHSLPDRVYRQEYMAEFIDDAGGVFRRVMDAATAEEKAPIAKHQYIIGVDWARSNDYTVFTVVDVAERAMVYMDRFSQVDYNLQSERLKALNKQYKPTTIIAEYNSMGGPIIERLQMEGLPVQGFTTTNASKAQIVVDLAVMFEQGTLRILNDPVLVGELQAFEGNTLPSGMMRYEAPEGMHDDTVMSLALAAHGIASGPTVLWSI